MGQTDVDTRVKIAVRDARINKQKEKIAKLQSDRQKLVKALQRIVDANRFSFDGFTIDEAIKNGDLVLISLGEE
jgi:hypothetical protein